MGILCYLYLIYTASLNYQRRIGRRARAGIRRVPTSPKTLVSYENTRATNGGLTLTVAKIKVDQPKTRPIVAAKSGILPSVCCLKGGHRRNVLEGATTMPRAKARPAVRISCGRVPAGRPGRRSVVYSRVVSAVRVRFCASRRPCSRCRIVHGLRFVFKFVSEPKISA